MSDAVDDVSRNSSFSIRDSAVKSFLGGLCDVDVATRYTIAQALESEWITSSQAQLEEMYRCRVLREERRGPSAGQQ